MKFFQQLFTADFMPHGHCYFWEPAVLWSHVLSDAAIAVAYFTIPVALAYFARQRHAQRHDLYFGWVLYTFAAFILLCGTTHVMDVLVVWQPYYRLQGVIKALTAVVSLGTAIALYPIIPKALALPSRRELDEKNKELELMARELRRSNDELGMFASAASHDLKAPLRGIEQLTEWLEQDYGERLPEAARRDLGLVTERAQRMQRLLESLLDYSRVGKSDEAPEVVDLRELITSLVALQDPPPGMRVEIAEDLPKLRVPKAALERVFGNLIANAIHHHDREEGEIRIAATRQGSKVEFSVSDDGPGIPAEFHDQVFQMFRTRGSDKKSTHAGVGMGLALVRKTVETHGGTITLVSGEGRGTTFRILWPDE